MNKIRILLVAMTLACHGIAMADMGGICYRSFHVEAVVHENNVWDVTETIKVDFQEPRHGIYRYIPLEYWLNHDVARDKGEGKKAADGQTVQEWQRFDYVSQVKDVNVEGWDFSLEDSDYEFCVIRIGSADSMVTGSRQYVINYKYVYNEDRRKQYDYLFHTILGTDFKESIDTFTFRVRFDKPLPSDISKRLKVYSGEFGNEDNKVENLDIKASQREISGVAHSVAPNHGITLYALLPEGYYNGVAGVNYTWHYLFLALTIATALILIYFMLRVRHKRVFRVMQYYPPKDMSSAEVGVLIDGSADKEDIASLIPWFAGQGYISVQETEKKGLMGKKYELTVKKLKDLPEQAPDYQKKMMKMLFAGGDETNLNSIAERPTDYERVRSSLLKHFTGKRKLVKFDKRMAMYVPLILFATMTLATNTVVETWSLFHIIYAFFLFAIPIALSVTLSYASCSRGIFDSIWKKIGIMLLKALAIALCAAVYAFLVDYGSPMSPWMVAGMFAATFVLGELLRRFCVDTDYRVEKAGELLGLKEFIKTADVPRLKEMQEADPKYFYTIMPFAMVFGLSKKWTNLFKDIDVEHPDWYQAARPLVGYEISKNIASTLHSASTNAIATVSHYSSSHGSGGVGGGGVGGGFSGGGGGGGGGGSW